jgi:hypothetical protein
MDTDAARAITATETTRSWRLWFAVLGSPLAWFGHLIVNYSLEEWFACSPSADHHQGQILGFSVRTVALTFNSAMVVVAAASGLAAFSCWRRLRLAGAGDEGLARARWMAVAGIVEAVLFLPIIFLGFVPPLLLHVCEIAP